ncbi:MAG: TIGR03088 family PEP-CTERM/XrtA system glycosyltransferase [Pseudomonadota bacterium]
MQTPACHVHVVHLVYRFATGGLENVIVQLINHLPRNEFRHSVVALTEADPEFVKRIERDDVEIISLGKLPGQPFRLYPAVYRLLRRLKPDVFHSCNLAAMEFSPMAALAGIPLRVHVEHGWDMGELGGENASYRTLRKLYKPFVNEFIAVATPLHDYLDNVIGVSSTHLHLIPNGVDTKRFRPRVESDVPPADFPFRRDAHWVIGVVGRLVPIKNPMMLVEAFVVLAKSAEPGTERMRLAIVGEGPLAEQIKSRMAIAGLGDRLWLPGGRMDIPDILRALDCFVLPSLSEATSCTLQEAMATGLDIVATHVGGNAELLEQGRCGSLVPSGDSTALARELLKRFKAEAEKEQGVAALASIRTRYGLPAVTQRYREIFLNVPLRCTTSKVAA